MTAHAPERVSKKKLTLAEAADQWEAATRMIDEQKPLREEAAEVLLEHFERTGRASYHDRIALVRGPARLILDQAKVRAYLGSKLSDFQKRSKPSRSLTLLDRVECAARDQRARSRRSAGGPKSGARGTRGNAGPRGRTAEAAPSR